jgi:glycosyltransferase involved in cell wall biosynthesis
MKRNILFFHNGSELYGGSKSLISIIGVLRNDFNIRVVLPEKGPLEKELTRELIHVDIVNRYPIISIQNIKSFNRFIKFIFDLIASLFAVKNIIKEFQPSLIHTNTSTIITSSLIAKIYSIPHVWHIREIYDGSQKYLWWFFQKYIYHYSNAIIANSKATASQFCRKNKLAVIYNVLLQNRKLSFNKELIIKFKEKYSVRQNLCVGMIGRINLNRKGQSIFVNAIAQIKDKHPNVKYFIIGEPYPGKEDYLHKLKNLIHNKQLDDQIILTGEIIDIHTAINTMDLIVIPSNRPESFGNVISESMANSKPVIISNIGGALEQVIDNKTGFIFKNGDYVDLSKKIDILLRDKNLRNDFGETGKIEYDKRFNPFIFKKKITTIYSKVL